MHASVPHTATDDDLMNIINDLGSISSHRCLPLWPALNQSHLRLSCMSTKTIKLQNYRIHSDVGDNNQELLAPQKGIIQTSDWSLVSSLVIQASISKAHVVPCFKNTHVWWKLYSASTNAVKRAAERKRLKLRYVHRLQLVFHQSVQDEPPQAHRVKAAQYPVFSSNSSNAQTRLP